MGCGCLAAGRARVRLAVALHFLAAALFAFVVGRVYFSVARSAFPVACLWVGRERGLVWVSQFGRGARCV